MLEIALLSSIAVALVGYRVHRRRRSQRGFLKRHGSADPASISASNADSAVAAVVPVPMREVATLDIGIEADNSSSCCDESGPAIDAQAVVPSPTIRAKEPGDLHADGASVRIADDPNPAPVVVMPSLPPDAPPSEARNVGELAPTSEESHSITLPFDDIGGVQLEGADSDVDKSNSTLAETAVRGRVGPEALDESLPVTDKSRDESAAGDEQDKRPQHAAAVGVASAEEHNSEYSVAPDAGFDTSAGSVEPPSSEPTTDPERSQPRDSLTITVGETTHEEIDALTLDIDSDAAPTTAESEPSETTSATLDASETPRATSRARPPNEKKAERSLNPRQYKPAPLRPATPRISRQSAIRPEGSSEEGVAPAVERVRSLSVSVRLRFKTSGASRLTLLAQRLEGMPEQLSVSGTHGAETLVALQEDLFEFEAPADIARILREGVVWVQDDSENGVAWSLAGREIYVLAESRDLGGYVTAPRLVVGDNHVVLCTESRLADTLTALGQVGAIGFVVVDGWAGLPEGWTGLRNVVPQIPSTTPQSGDILDVLRPLPDIEIVLNGGISLDRSSWLLGYPPTIRIYGDVAHAGEPLVDGKAADITADGCVQVAGWDEVGPHTVSVAGTNRSYSIKRGIEEWEAWPAYNWPRRRSLGGSMSVCGGLVLANSLARARRGAQVVPQRDSVLIGAEPGQVHVCSQPSNSAAQMCVAAPSFDPIWAIPRSPLRCDKTVHRIILLTNSHKAPVNNRIRSSANLPSLREWSRLILEASKRHLAVSPDQRAATDLWADYRRVAHGVWRATR